MRDQHASTKPHRDAADPGPDAGSYRVLPAVSDLVRAAGTADGDASAEVMTRLAQDYLARQRARIAGGERLDREAIMTGFSHEQAELARPRLRPVLNATGVIIHTNLGRAPVSPEAAAAMASAAAHPVALEIEPATNRRGGRMREISALMRLLTGAEATLVVNNGAAAVLLAVSALGAGRGVIVSRGEAVEIGGGFRIPDVVRQSGATLVEVGTTNRTYVADYAEASDERTAAYLRVHPSNFVLTGFAHRPSTAELARLGHERGIPLIEDLGSGALLDAAAYGLAPEPTFAATLEAGATLVTASGDKLLGGPQAGIICGEADVVERISRHPLARAVRADKTCLAGLAATLRHYARGEATGVVPVWRMIVAPAAEIRGRAEAARRRLAASGVECSVVEVRSSVGGGSLPGQELPSWALALPGPADALAHRLRRGEPAVFSRIEHGQVRLDLRTIRPDDDDALIAAIRQALAEPPSPG